jgi:hypothetical protein
MERLLLVANQPISDTALHDLVISKVSTDGGVVHVVLTARNTQIDSVEAAVHEFAIERDEPSVPDHAPSEQGSSEQELANILARLKTAGVHADGEIGDADPLVAIRAAMSQDRYGEVLLCTLKAGASRWFHMDLPHRIMREFQIEVEWVEANPDPRSEEHHEVHIAMPSVLMKNVGMVHDIDW